MNLIAVRTHDNDSVQFFRIMRKSTNWAQVQLYGSSSVNLRTACILPVYGEKKHPSSLCISEHESSELKSIVEIVPLDELKGESLVSSMVLLTEDYRICPSSFNFSELVKHQGIKYLRKYSVVERWTQHETDILRNGENTSMSQILESLGKNITLKEKIRVRNKMSRLGLEFIHDEFIDFPEDFDRQTDHPMKLRSRIYKPTHFY